MAFTKVLDHGFVHLLDAMPNTPGGGDARIVQAARVSMAHLPEDFLASVGLPFVPEERAPEQDAKLIRYLLANRHTSPFEQVKFTFVVKAPIFVERQWIRHRMANTNEQSARYSKLPNEFYVPALDRMAMQHSSNKQASGEVFPTHLAAAMHSRIHDASANAYVDYELLLEQGLARELARMVLPTNFYTQKYWTVDLHNLMHFLRLRLHAHAQYEIRVYAEAILPMVEEIAPVAIAAFRETLVV